MKRYYKEKENGTKEWFKGILRVDGYQVINPSEEQLLAAGYVEYVPPVPAEPTEEELFLQARQNKLAELHDYDGSDAVNDCIISYQGEEIHYWAKVEERTELEKAVRNCMEMGRENYRLDLRDKGVSMTIPCGTLLQMLAALEVYAVDCFNVTTDHEFAIRACSTMQQLKEYDFTVGYPEKLTFNI